MAREARIDQNNTPHPPRFLFITRTACLAVAAVTIWIAIELMRFWLGAPLWHFWDESAFIATAFTGSGGFLVEALNQRIWPVCTNAVCNIGYYVLVALSGAPLAYL